MPERRPRAQRPAGERPPAERQADHAAIDRLADELLPSLVARLAASGLGELEVREGDWRVRLSRPAGADRRPPPSGRAAPGRSAPKAQHDDGRGREGGAGASAPASAGEGSDPLPPLTAVVLAADEATDPGPTVATSPAVGIFRAGPTMRAGTRLRVGDRLGTVDVLGVAVEVTAPVDGIIATNLVADGDAVEYGQPVVALQPSSRGPGAASSSGGGA